MGFVFTVLLTLASLAVLAVVARLLIEMFVRLALGLMLAVGLGVASGIVLAENGLNGPFVGTMFALLASVPCMVWVWRWRAAVQQREAGAQEPVFGLASDAPFVPVEDRLGLKDAADLRKAWDDAARIAPAARLEAPREACAKFLKVAAAELLPAAGTTELAVLIRKQVPGLVGDTLAVLELSASSDAGDAVRFMLDELRALGDEAENALTAMRLRAQDKLSVRRARLSQRRIERGIFS